MFIVTSTLHEYYSQPKNIDATLKGFRVTTIWGRLPSWRFREDASDDDRALDVAVARY